MYKQENKDRYYKSQLDMVRYLTTYGAFQRAKTYKKEFGGDANSAIRDKFRNQLFEIIRYETPRFLSLDNDDDFFAYLKLLNDKINHNTNVNILEGNRYRIGNTQKLMNLYWKMLWLIVPNTPIPLHCPFDRIIIQKLEPSVRKIKWTEFDSISLYQEIVDSARRISNIPVGSLAYWELKEYSV